MQGIRFECDFVRQRAKPWLGFTLVETMIVIAILVIIAMMIIPSMSTAASMQIRSAANVIAADLEYAKSMAISRQQTYSVVFDAANESYEIRDAAGAVIPHPVNKGSDYSIDFNSDARLDKVDIVSVDFDGTQIIKFDILGSPFNGDGNSLNSGIITLQAAELVITVSVEPLTGFVTISD